MAESKRQALIQAFKQIKLWLCGFVPDWSLDVTDAFFWLCSTALVGFGVNHFFSPMHFFVIKVEFYLL